MNIPEYFDHLASPIKLAIVGSRNIENINLSQFLTHPEKIKVIVSGGAKGIDTLAALFAKNNGIGLCELKPNYKKNGRAATFIRNREIVESSDMVLAFWDGTSHGTKYTIEYAAKHGKLLDTVII